MKNIIFLMLVPLVFKAQKIIENKKDDMTGNLVIKTSKERLTGGMSSNWIKADVRRINEIKVIGMQVSISGVFFIVAKDAEVFIKLSNDTIVKGKSIALESAHDGMGGKQADLVYLFNDYSLLKSNSITKIRIYTTEGYKDFEIPEKNKDIVKKELELVDNIK